MRTSLPTIILESLSEIFGYIFFTVGLWQFIIAFQNGYGLFAKLGIALLILFGLSSIITGKMSSQNRWDNKVAILLEDTIARIEEIEEKLNMKEEIEDL